MNFSEEGSTSEILINTSQANSYVIPYTQEWVIASTIILVIFFIFGLFANSATIAVICTSPLLKNHYYKLLASICVSDIVSAFVSILFLYRRTWGFDYFEWPEFFCRLYWGLDLWTSFATALHILSFASLRLIGVQWPTVFQRITSKVIKIWLALIWTVTFFGGFIPHFIFNTANQIDRQNDPNRSRWASCSLSPYWFSTWQIYVQYAYAFFIYLPAIGIIVTSIIITVLLRKKSALPKQKSHITAVHLSGVENSSTVGSGNATPLPKRRNRCSKTAADRRWRKNKQLIVQLALIVGSFLLGYIPFTAFHFYTGFTIEQSDAVINAIDWKFALVQYIMLRFSECLNPVFYNLASKKMRNETIKMLKKIFLIKKSSPADRVTTIAIRVTNASEYNC